MTPAAQGGSAAEPGGARFCPNCGVSLAGAPCVSCGTALPAGARFCHRCGAAAPSAVARHGPAATSTNAQRLPWIVAAVALVAFIGLAAAQRFGGGRATDAASDAEQAGGPRGIVAAPDISSLTPAQRAERLYDRVMAASERGRDDSVRFFMPMAVGAYQALGELTTDQRYDLGRLGEVSGDTRLATAQADTILRRTPDHLLGLVLASRAARLRGDNASARRYLDRLAKVDRSERQKQLPEYLVHQNDIDTALREPRP